MRDHTKSDVEELAERILAGVRKAVRKLIEENAVKGEEMVVGDRHGNVRIVPARALLRELEEQEKEVEWLRML